MADLNDENYWQVFYFGLHDKDIKVELNALIDSKYIRAKVENKYVPSTWKRAGKLKLMANSPGNINFVMQKEILPLNEDTLITIPPSFPLFYVRFEPVPWLFSFYLEIKLFTG